MRLYNLVVSAYQNASLNGYTKDLQSMTDEELAEDMWNYDVDIAEFQIEEVIKAVQEFRKGIHNE